MNYFKNFIECITILFLSYVLVSWLQTCGLLAPQLGIESVPPALEVEVPTTGLSGSPYFMHNGLFFLIPYADFAPPHFPLPTGNH